MRTPKRLLAPLGLALVLLAAPGCLAAAVVVGAAAIYGGVQYSENEAWIEVDDSLDATWQATLEAMNDNGYPVSMSATHSATAGHIESGDAEVDVTLQPADRTRVTVRVGTFRTEEHKRRASLILERVVRNLE